MLVLPPLVEIATPVAIVLFSLLLGVVFERVVLARLRVLVDSTKWAGDEVFIRAVKGVVVMAFLVAGLYAALLASQVSPLFFLVARKTLMAVFILLATVVVGRVAVGFIELYASTIPGIQPSTSIFTHIARLLIFVLGVLMILQTLGVSITPILTALGVGGLGVALALQDTLANLFAGLHLIASRQIRVGDYVQLDSGDAGYVDDITWRNTTIKGLPGNMVVVPNAKMASSVLTNFNQPEKQMSVIIQVGVGYGSDLDHVERVTIEVAKGVMSLVAGGMPDFEPFIRYHTFGDSSINFSVILRVREFVDQYMIKHEFIKQLHQRFQQENIEIPFPIRTVIMKDGAGTETVAGSATRPPE